MKNNTPLKAKENNIFKSDVTQNKENDLKSEMNDI